MSLFVCLSWDFLLWRFEIEKRGCNRKNTRETKSVATLFFIWYIVFFFEKRKTRNTLVADAEATPATVVVAFVLSMHYYDAQILTCSNPFLLSLVLLPSTRFPLLFFFFFFFARLGPFFLPLFIFFLLLLFSFWVMSNLRVSCI